MGKIKLFLKAVKSLVQKRRIASLWKSSLLLKKAIEEAEEKNKQDGRRYFVIWDPAQQKLISITYDYIRTGGTVINIFFIGEGSVCE